MEAPIRRINEVYTKRMVSPDGQYAKTDWEVLSRGGVFPAPAEALHRRTHQIRAHGFTSATPGRDDLYGGDLAIIPPHSCGWVRFPHPVTGAGWSFLPLCRRICRLFYPMRADPQTMMNVL